MCLLCMLLGIRGVSSFRLLVWYCLDGGRELIDCFRTGYGKSYADAPYSGDGGVRVRALIRCSHSHCASIR
jgi:hypothetical protein